MGTPPTRKTTILVAISAVTLLIWLGVYMWYRGGPVETGDTEVTAMCSACSYSFDTFRIPETCPKCGKKGTVFQAVKCKQCGKIQVFVVPPVPMEPTGRRNPEADKKAYEEYGNLLKLHDETVRNRTCACGGREFDPVYPQRQLEKWKEREKELNPSSTGAPSGGGKP